MCTPVYIGVPALVHGRVCPCLHRGARIRARPCSRLTYWLMEMRKMKCGARSLWSGWLTDRLRCIATHTPSISRWVSPGGRQSKYTRPPWWQTAQLHTLVTPTNSQHKPGRKVDFAVINRAAICGITERFLNKIKNISFFLI